jgi:hypothetical protein
LLRPDLPGEERAEDQGCDDEQGQGALHADSGGRGCMRGACQLSGGSGAAFVRAGRARGRRAALAWV